MNDIVNRYIDVALTAGQAIVEVYGSGDMGSITNPVSSLAIEADTRAEAVTRERLRGSFPDILIIAKDKAAAGRIPAKSNCFFLFDPRDGTKGLLSRNEEFTVSSLWSRLASP